jgi:hypothetical protein
MTGGHEVGGSNPPGPTIRRPWWQGKYQQPYERTHVPRPLQGTPQGTRDDPMRSTSFLPGPSVKAQTDLQQDPEGLQSVGPPQLLPFSARPGPVADEDLLDPFSAAMNFPVASASMPNPSWCKRSDRHSEVSATLKHVSTSVSQLLNRKLAHIPNTLFPTTYQREYAVCARNDLVP